MGVARALEHLSMHLTSAVALHVLRFMIPQGLGDRHSDVRAAMLGAGLAILDTHGQVRPSATIVHVAIVVTRPHHITLTTH